MKRQIVLITFLSLVIGITASNAKQGIIFRATYNGNNSDPAKYATKDIREFHAFQQDIKDFSKAVYRDKTVRARRIKSDILRRMRNEIKDTQTKIRYTKRNLGYHDSKPGLHNKKRQNRNDYTKRSGNNLTKVERHLRFLDNQLRNQKRILIKLDRMNLLHGYDFHFQSRIHLDLMNEFEDILKKDISKSFQNYRTNSRRY